MSNEIKCPHCGEMFTIDEAGFAAILKQVRDAEFDKEVRRHEQLMASEKQQAVQLAVAEALAKAQGDAAQKEARIAELEARLQAEQRERESQQEAGEYQEGHEGADRGESALDLDPVPGFVRQEPRRRLTAGRIDVPVRQDEIVGAAR